MSDTPIFDSVDNSHSTPEPNKTPQPKVVAATSGAGVGGALAVITNWIIEASTGIDIPESVELATVVVFTAGLAFVSGYWKRN